MWFHAIALPRQNGKVTSFDTAAYAWHCTQITGKMPLNILCKLDHALTVLSEPLIFQLFQFLQNY